MTFKGLRVGLVGPLPPPAGGMAGQTRQLAELLAAEGASVTLIQTNAPYRPAWVGRARGIRALFRLVPYVWALWRCAARVDVFHVMANSGWSWHLFAAPAVWIAKLRAVPVLVNYRGGQAEAFLSQAAAWAVPTLRRADMLAVPSGFLQEVFARFGMTAHVLPNIIDVGRFRPGPHPRAASRAPRLVIARNLEAIYGNATALRAFAIVLKQVPSASLLIAGSGPERAALEDLARELGVAQAVTFTGSLERDEMAELYRSADVVINPSTVDNMPNSVLEALASGVPVVSTRVGGVPYMVRDGMSALLVDPDEPEALAEAVLRVLHDPELASRLSENGLLEAQQSTWACVAPRLLNLYDSALSARRSDMLTV